MYYSRGLSHRTWVGEQVDRLVRQRNVLFLLLWHKRQVLRGDITNTEICTLLKIWIMTLVSWLDRKVFFFFNKSNIWVLRELLSLLSHWPERKRLEIRSSNDIIKFDIFVENIISKEHMWILKFSKKNLREKRD